MENVLKAERLEMERQGDQLGGFCREVQARDDDGPNKSGTVHYR